MKRDNDKLVLRCGVREERGVEEEASGEETASAARAMLRVAHLLGQLEADLRLAERAQVLGEVSAVLEDEREV